MDRFNARWHMLGALCVAGLLAACGSAEHDGGSPQGTSDATAVSAQGAEPPAGGLKGVNSKVDPIVRPGAEAPLDRAPESAHDSADVTPVPPTAPTLKFASGFEEGVALTPPTGARLGDRQLVGSDPSGFAFPVDLWAAPSHWRNWVLSTVGEVAAGPVTDYLTVSLKTVVGRDDRITRALSLHSRIQSGGGGSQQIVVQNVGMGQEAVLFQRMWIKLDTGMLGRASATRNPGYLQTYWEAIARPDYRIRLGIAYDPAKGLYWKAQADLVDGGPLAWEAELSTVPVVLASHAEPSGWHKVEIWMDRPNGRFKAAIDGRTLADISGNLIGRSGNRIDQLRMMMLHSAAAPLGEVLFDDLEIWDAPPPDAWRP